MNKDAHKQKDRRASAARRRGFSVPGLVQAALNRDMRQWLYVLLLLAAFGGRLLIAACQRVYLEPQSSSIDDMLMVNASKSILAGEWMGPYGAMTIAKNMGFALWLAFQRVLHIPYLLGNAAFWAAACFFAVACLRPLFRGRLARLVLFCFLAFQPVSYAQYTLRVYRDAIFPALCLFFFAGVVGLALRLPRKYARGSLGCGLGAGFGLMGAWLTREDGPVLLPFALCGLGLVLLFALFAKSSRARIRKALCALVPFGVLAAGVVAFSAVNYSYYGVFMVNDLGSGSFPAAYGAIAAVGQAEGGFVKQVPVPRKALFALVDEVPSLAFMEEYLNPAMSGFANPFTQEYGGSFYFALRIAAQYEGLTPNGAAAQAFWARVEREVAQAVEQGRLKSEKPLATTVPRFHAELLGPTLAETGSGVWTVLGFQQCEPRPVVSIGDAGLVSELADYLYSEEQVGYVEGTDAPWLNVLQRLVFVGCDVLIWLYRILVWPLLALAFWGLGRGLKQGVMALLGKGAQRRAEEPGEPAGERMGEVDVDHVFRAMDTMAPPGDKAYVPPLALEEEARPAATAPQGKAPGTAAPADSKQRDNRQGQAAALKEEPALRLVPALLLSVLALGLLLSFLLRMGVAAYMEVAAFNIGTYLMYLAGGVPPLLLFCALAPGLLPAETPGAATVPGQRNGAATRKKKSAIAQQPAQGTGAGA